MQSLAILFERWKNESVDPVQPTEGAEVRRIFSELGSSATSDVVSLYQTIGGMNMMDNTMWRLWPLAEVQAENTTTSRFGVLFADYLIACWCYRLKPAGEHHSAVYVDYFDGNDPKLVAGSLQEFFDAYVADARQLLDPRSALSDS